MAIFRFLAIVINGGQVFAAEAFPRHEAYNNRFRHEDPAGKGSWEARLTCE